MNSNSQCEDTFNLSAVPDALIGTEVGRWMRGVDQAFANADASELIWGHVAALTMAMTALKRLPGFDAEMTALRDLHARLEKLTVGQKQPLRTLVESVKPPGRAPASYSDHIGEVRAVSLVHALTKRGWQEPEALKLVAKELARIGYKGRRGEPLSARAVSDWCDKIRASDPVYQAAMQDFDELLPSNMPKLQLKAFARAFLKAGRSLRD